MGTPQIVFTTDYHCVITATLHYNNMSDSLWRFLGPKMMNASDTGNNECASLVKKNHDDTTAVMEKIARVNTEPASLQRLTLAQLATIIDNMETHEATFRVAANQRGNQDRKEIATLREEFVALEQRHREETAALEQKHREEAAPLEQKLNVSLDKQEQQEQKNAIDSVEIQRKKEALQAELRNRGNPGLAAAAPLSTPPTSLIPECPACYEEMRPPLQIYTCGNGHLICSTCKAKIKDNRCIKRCGAEYTGRATFAEQMVRQILGIM